MANEIQELRRDMPRRASDREKWFWLWDRFFAGHPRPESPYVLEGILEPFSLLARIAMRNATTTDFFNWTQYQMYPPYQLPGLWEGVLSQLLTLRHERAPLSRRVPRESPGDRSILVSDAHLTTMGYGLPYPVHSNAISNFDFLLQDHPVLDLDGGVGHASSSTARILGDGNPESSSANSVSVQNNWNPSAIIHTDERISRGVAPPETSRPMEMEDVFDFQDGSEKEGPPG
ncbi:hypothetical protein BDP55DRAFT_746694 [Colletotrichum godetiae]|uniref:Uncharacterized protein n=1 Tax=Colletotrichum godetiae TaxID=1209918 RepID=A0AAJ0ERQ7_9PEZI|nr:uncharacterized protein BDP55DRAFT_746694 [Colletotrichum godetiae]KAK1674211.1 hypothetical protein BDP55DRAFT_746694 [Colletotrichum godetiae]